MYEYLRIELNNETVDWQKIVDAGNEGWELVSVSRMFETVVIFYFKRKKK